MKSADVYAMLFMTSIRREKDFFYRANNAHESVCSLYFTILWDKVLLQHPPFQVITLVFNQIRIINTHNHKFAFSFLWTAHPFTRPLEILLCLKKCVCTDGEAVCVRFISTKNACITMRNFIPNVTANKKRSTVKINDIGIISLHVPVCGTSRHIFSSSLDTASFFLVHAYACSTPSVYVFFSNERLCNCHCRFLLNFYYPPSNVLKLESTNNEAFLVATSSSINIK